MRLEVCWHHCERSGAVLRKNVEVTGFLRHFAPRNDQKRAAAPKQKGVKVIGLTGKLECPLAEASDILLATPAGAYADRVQELHIKLIHIMIELVERRMFPENYD